MPKTGTQQLLALFLEWKKVLVQKTTPTPETQKPLAVL
jgi:hypothetical protein